MDLTPVTLRAGALDLAVPTGGAPDAPLVLLLHGFPDTPYTWRHLAPALVAAGYRVATPFLRGYAPSGLAPDGRYHLANLASDALALRDALGGDARTALVGHDWGASASYLAAAASPDRFRCIVTLAIPPLRALAGRPPAYDQLKRSWYLYFFQQRLATQLLEADTAGFVRRLWRDWSPAFDPGDDVPHVVAALPDRAHVEAALGYYRSMMGQIAPDPALAALEAARMRPAPLPTLYLHGVDDGCVGIELAADAERHLPAGSVVERVADAGHFLHLERPEYVGERILRFLGTPPA